MRTINVAQEFSQVPGPRYRSQGNYSGEEFRDDFIIPALAATTDMVVVNLDGTSGYAASFLEEVFGGLVRKTNADEATFDRISIMSKDEPDLLDDIDAYVIEAVKEYDRGNYTRS